MNKACLEYVVSGGQVGADIAGLRAAKAAGIPTTGWMPAGFRTIDGPRPEYAEEYGIKEMDSVAYPPRTRANVRWAEATVRFAYDWNSPGERLTARLAREMNRPMYDIGIERDTWTVRAVPEALVVWIVQNDWRSLNVAGNANELIEDPVEDYLYQVFRQVRRKEES